MTELPTITPEILSQWEVSARADLEAERPWSTHPSAILAVIRTVRESRGDSPSGFWSQRDWEDWSNRLAMILPEDVECWPGVNPEGAQESIIENALRYLVDVEAKVPDGGDE